MRNHDVSFLRAELVRINEQLEGDTWVTDNRFYVAAHKDKCVLVYREFKS